MKKSKKSKESKMTQVEKIQTLLQCHDKQLLDKSTEKEFKKLLNKMVFDLKKEI
jgi:hypothetical protein